MSKRGRLSGKVGSVVVISIRIHRAKRARRITVEGHVARRARTGIGYGLLQHACRGGDGRPWDFEVPARRFMLTYPPLRVYDIWKDSYFDMARSKSERLLMAAIDYSVERHVVYVAATPPSGRCQSLAARQGKKIIYIPIGAFPCHAQEDPAVPRSRGPLRAQICKQYI